MDFIQDFDFSVLEFIQQNMRCEFLDAVFPVITSTLFVGLFWGTAAVCMLFTKKYRRCGIAAIVCILLGLLCGNLILKHLVARARPCWLKPIEGMIVAVPKDFSFPSAHTAISFVTAIVFLRHSRAIGIPALAVAALLAFTRLYVYVHFPTDILGGLILAVLLAIFGDMLTQRVIDRIIEKKKQKSSS